LTEEKSALEVQLANAELSISEYRDKVKNLEEELMKTSKMMEEIVSAKNDFEDLKAKEQSDNFKEDFERLRLKYEEETKKVKENVLN
jgi:hypothetical protein